MPQAIAQSDLCRTGDTTLIQQVYQNNSAHSTSGAMNLFWPSFGCLGLNVSALSIGVGNCSSGPSLDPSWNYNSRGQYQSTHVSGSTRFCLALQPTQTNLAAILTLDHCASDSMLNRWMFYPSLTGGQLHTHMSPPSSLGINNSPANHPILKNTRVLTGNDVIMHDSIISNSNKASAQNLVSSYGDPIPRSSLSAPPTMPPMPPIPPSNTQNFFYIRSVSKK